VRRKTGEDKRVDLEVTDAVMCFRERRGVYIESSVFIIKWKKSVQAINKQDEFIALIIGL
jgi:hypothetical protein